jgi:hypothetical protein
LSFLENRNPYIPKKLTARLYDIYMGLEDTLTHSLIFILPDQQ